jgi:hypothetical protein
MTIIVFLSITGHVVVATQPIMYSPCLQWALQMVMVLYMVQWPKPSFLKDWAICSLAWIELWFTLITWHGNTAICPKVSLISPWQSGSTSLANPSLPIDSELWQFYGIIIVFPSGKIPPTGAKTFEPSGHKHRGKKAKIVLVVAVQLPFPTLDFLTQEFWISEQQHSILDTDSECM